MEIIISLCVIIFVGITFIRQAFLGKKQIQSQEQEVKNTFPSVFNKSSYIFYKEDHAFRFVPLNDVVRLYGVHWMGERLHNIFLTDEERDIFNKFMFSLYREQIQLIREQEKAIILQQLNDIQ